MDWNGNHGDSADGEDEAEEDSDEPEEETDEDFAPGKTDNEEAANRAPQETLIPLDPLIKLRAESEDGAYADVEDSETEINSQEDITSLETKTVKNIST
ncbi:hypothetical protein GBF38_005972 [Nibea albiflora]|uniref:Uncharacterized protein n=1 Tax=Nibea albiflora TaxID=240163 RepID=A0ACB7FAF9_NIBAL|nr:hypothetical protein GBF38_005972 [Nibea albiflora]